MTNPINHQNPIDIVNKGSYERPDILKHYEKVDFLFKPEQALLQKLLPAIKDKKLLDIGIGAGRTTKFLLEISRDYTGIDYSLGFVRLARKKYKDADIRRCDARDLKIFSDNTFDFILFSFNGIDYVVHKDRIRILEEIYRVLKPDGFYLFSTHNRDSENFNKLPWQEKVRFTFGHLKSCLYSLYYLRRHFRVVKYQSHANEYSIINDNAHGYSLLTYYISIGEQIKQLEDVGFHYIEAYDAEGINVNGRNASPWIYYLAKK